MLRRGGIGRTLSAGGHNWNQRYHYIEDSFVSCQSHFQGWTKGAHLAPVPLRGIEARSQAAIITNKNFLLHGRATAYHGLYIYLTISKNLPGSGVSTSNAAHYRTVSSSKSW